MLNEYEILLRQAYRNNTTIQHRHTCKRCHFGFDHLCDDWEAFEECDPDEALCPSCEMDTDGCNWACAYMSDPVKNEHTHDCPNREGI